MKSSGVKLSKSKMRIERIALSVGSLRRNPNVFFFFVRGGGEEGEGGSDINPHQPPKHNKC